jgi:hypothetical protein
MSDAHAGVVRTRVVFVGALALAWLVVWLDLLLNAARTHWGDLTPEVLLAGPALAFTAGAITWRIAPAHRHLRFGALAGLVMLATYVAGYVPIVVVEVLPYRGGATGETPISLLLEAWFWIGVPTVVCGGMGALGWATANTLAHLGRVRPQPR